MARSEPPSDPGPASSLDQVEELVAECVERWDTEGEAALEALCAEHPSLAEELRRQFQLLQAAGVLHEEDEEDAFPERLGKYRLLRRLGGGGMGVVFLAEEEPVGRPVAIKLIRPDQAFFEGSRKRFQREMDAISRLQHPGIVPVYALEESKGVPFFVMENVEGCTLAEVLADLEGRATATLSARDLAEAIARRTPGEVPVPGDEEVQRRFGKSWADACLTIVLQIAEALDHAHRRGVLHRDVKPSNIMVTPNGRALLLDFGLARNLDGDKLTRTGSHLGSLPYMAPEQLRGRNSSADPRVDVYALGITLYEMLARRSPYLREDTEATRGAVLDGVPRRLQEQVSGLSWEAETVCFSAMAAEPGMRYVTAADFARDLHNVLEGRSIVARRPSTLRRARRWIQRHPTLSVFLVLFGLVSVLSVWIAYDRDQSLKLLRAERAERKAAETQSAQFSADRVRLYYSYHLESLFSRELDLWPARPETVTRRGGMNDWLIEAAQAEMYLKAQGAVLSDLRKRGRRLRSGDLDREDLRVDRLLTRREELLAEMETVRARGGPELERAERDLNEELFSLEQERTERWSWRFEGDVEGGKEALFDQRWHDYLSHLGRRLDHLLQLVPRVQRRRELALQIGPRSLEAEAEDWRLTAEEVAADPRYAGLELVPQWGLVPLGRDPVSGLFEFAHLLSSDLGAEGDVPTRGDDGGLRLGPASGLVFVLIPPQPAEDGRPALSAFLISKHEMRREHWSRLNGEDPSRRPAPAVALDCVSWQEGRRMLRHMELDLPTVAQFAAATGLLLGDGPPRLLPGGDGGRTLPRHGLVGTLRGVAEWCRDVPATPENPARPGDGEVAQWRGARHAVLGGSFRRSELVRREFPDTRDDDLGLRPVRALEGPREEDDPGAPPGIPDEE